MKVLALKAMLGKSVLFKYVVLLVRRVPGTHWVLALWLGFIRAYPAFLRGMLPSSVMPLVTNPPPLAHPQAAVFSLQMSLSWPLGCSEQTKQRLGWGRTKCGGAGEVTLLSPYPGMFGK